MMRRMKYPSRFLMLSLSTLLAAACANPEAMPPDAGSKPAGQAGANGGAGQAASGTAGASSGAGGAAGTSAGTAGMSGAGTAGSSVTGTAGTSVTGTAGTSVGGSAGAAGTHGAAGAGGSTAGTSGGGTAGATSGAWRPFSNDSPWNTPIAANPDIDADSATMITDFSTIPGQMFLWVNIQSYSVPVYFVDASTPKVLVKATVGGTGFRTGAANDAAVAGTGMAPIPAGAMAAMGADKHLSIIDRVANTEWGFWNAQNNAGWTAGMAATMDLSGSGVRPPTSNNPWWAGQGPRACGFPIIAGLITVDQIKSGSIDHALIVAYPRVRTRYYTPPASSAQGGTRPTQGILCGGHIQLDPSLDLSTMGLSPTGLIIARALQKYGAFIGDFSGAVSIYADASPTALTYWNGGALGNHEVDKLPLTKFRVLKQAGMTYDNNN
jgi:hypothetical protein